MEQIAQVPWRRKCGISEAASTSLKRACNESRRSFGKVTISFGAAWRTRVYSVHAGLVECLTVERRRLTNGSNDRAGCIFVKARRESMIGINHLRCASRRHVVHPYRYAAL